MSSRHPVSLVRLSTRLGFAAVLLGCSLGAQALVPFEGASKIASGASHNCALTTGGGVKCWGRNFNGQLGDNTTTQRATPVDVSGLASGVVAIAAGSSHNCVLTTGGGVKCWGNNASGQLGDGSTTQRRTPVNVSGLASGVAAIAAGGAHTCALTTGGAVKCWGYNLNGQLGDGSTTQRLAPVDVPGLASGVAAMAAGGQHTCAISTTGAMKCWGDNFYGQIGDNSQIQRLTPVDVSGLPSGVSALSAGERHTCALTTGGAAKCWGQNTYGQLGDGSQAQRLVPTNVSGITSGAVAIEAGNSHTCALATGGGAKCWGRNDAGQLGDNSIILFRSTPVDVSGLTSGVSALAAGTSHSCALTTSSGVMCWGDNTQGQLGDNGAAERLTAVDVSGLATGASAISAGYNHSCAAIAAGGTKCWGLNSSGQLGDNTTQNRLVPVVTSGLTAVVTAIAAGNSHTCVLTSGGGVKCWGSNGDGRVGDNTILQRNTPVDVAGLASGSSAIATGYYHTCAVTAEGGAKCWGSNQYGQLGDNSTVNRLAPVAVSGLASGVAALAAGREHTCAVTTGGGVKCWGNNTYGQLGDASTIQRFTPVDVTGLGAGVVAVAAGQDHTCAITTGGGAKCWGFGTTGQLGDGSQVNRLTPVDVSGLASSTASIAGGGQYSCALTTGGGAKCWGFGGNGQLGDGSIALRLTPVDVSGLVSGVSAITTGNSHTCALTTGGGAKCWGFNSEGRLGDGTAGTRPYPAPVLVAGVPGAVRSGFNGDAFSDIFWRDSTGGLNYQWQMNGLALIGQGYMPSVPSNWSPVAVGDVNGDGRADIFWREIGGLNYLWAMNGLVVATQGYYPSVPPPWIVTGLGDVTGDGKADVFWRNPTTGDNYLWVLDGPNITGQGYFPNVGGTDWEMVGVADYSGDGKADALWRNKVTGDNYLWILDGLTLTGQGFLPVVPSDWEIVASPNADGNTTADVFWRNKVTGDNYLWLVNGLTVTGQGYLPAVSDMNWKVVGFGDYNGDGKGDILWRNSTTGQVYLWLLDGLAVSSQGFLPSVDGTNWMPVR